MLGEFRVVPAPSAIPGRRSSRPGALDIASVAVLPISAWEQASVSSSSWAASGKADKCPVPTGPQPYSPPPRRCRHEIGTGQLALDHDPCECLPLVTARVAIAPVTWSEGRVDPDAPSMPSLTDASRYVSQTGNALDLAGLVTVAHHVSSDDRRPSKVLLYRTEVEPSASRMTSLTSSSHHGRGRRPLCGRRPGTARRYAQPCPWRGRRANCAHIPTTGRVNGNGRTELQTCS
jgi:hypothetical protein